MPAIEADAGNAVLGGYLVQLPQPAAGTHQVGKRPAQALFQRPFANHCHLSVLVIQHIHQVDEALLRRQRTLRPGHPAHQ